MSKIKKILFLFIGLLTVSAAFFWGTILTHVVEYSFRAYCRDCVSALLKAEKVTHGDHFVAFENVSLVGKERAEDIHFASFELILYFEPHFLKREIDLYVTIQDPKIDLALMGPAIRNFLESFHE